MKARTQLTLAQIGNSRGIRLPSALIRKHGLENGLILEDRGHELVITPKGGPKKLSWEETYKEIAALGEDGSDWDAVVADGLDHLPWESSLADKSASSKRVRKVRSK